MGRAAQVTIPVAVQGGEYDQVVPAPHWAHPAFDRIPSRDRLYVEIARAEHIRYANFDLPVSPVGMPAAAWLPGSAPLGTAQLHPIVSRYATAWMEKHLLGAADPLGYTDGRQAALDLAAGRLSDFAR
jgi:hypothetical protein